MGRPRRCARGASKNTNQLKKRARPSCRRSGLGEHPAGDEAGIDATAQVPHGDLTRERWVNRRLPVAQILIRLRGHLYRVGDELPALARVEAHHQRGVLLPHLDGDADTLPPLEKGKSQSPTLIDHVQTLDRDFHTAS